MQLLQWQSCDQNTDSKTFPSDCRFFNFFVTTYPLFTFHFELYIIVTKKSVCVLSASRYRNSVFIIQRAFTNFQNNRIRIDVINVIISILLKRLTNILLVRFQFVHLSEYLVEFYLKKITEICTFHQKVTYSYLLDFHLYYNYFLWSNYTFQL